MNNSIYYHLLLAGLLFAGACSEQKEQNSHEDVQVEKISTTATGGQQVGRTGEEQKGKMQAAKAAFAQQYPQAGSVEWNEDANGYFEASFEQAGEKFRADYTRDGQWVETESSLKYEKLPKAVQSALKRAGYDKKDITEIEQVDNAERGKFYDVEFKKKGKNHDVEIREDGQIIEE